MVFWRAMAKGFTLIEMAIVLVVIGLILSGGLLALGPVLEGTKTTETRARLDVIEKALVLYTIQNGCLPCPADGDLGTAAGLAAGDTSDYNSGCQTCATLGVVGAKVVPWGALGLSPNDATDGWGNLISYIVDDDLTLTDSMERNGSTYPTGNLEVNDSATTATVITEGAAYVLISHGSDGRGAYTLSGTLIAAPNAGNAVQINNASGVCPDGAPCYQGDKIGIPGNDEFDDIVRWRRPDLIIEQCGDNACGNPA